MARESELIKPEDVRYLKNALASIGTKIETTPITTIVKDETTGEIRAESAEGEKPLKPMAILEILNKTPIAPVGYFAKGAHKPEAYRNIRTVAGLGDLALGTMVEEGKPFSVTRLKTIQRILDDIHVDMYVTSVRGNKDIPGFDKALAYINSVVYRTWAKRQFAEDFETEE